ncbi:hypothetical protein GL218_04709 [Daldinia childiae]|uniref:uncharacterized protein n=1 Tax=Daldinia childiae TaxID=326645 RepID=UPI001447EFED|nr:uncharacterized protein GL218_04709 [Daldinia childiae]KAF3059940.1 hypothetical protein GL218_04709 [Daldinia childiae]
MDTSSTPFTTNLLQLHVETDKPAKTQSLVPQATIDDFPASFRDTKGKIHILNDPTAFLSKELSLQKLEVFSKYFWAIGSKRPAAPLNYQIYSRREIIPCERLDLHLVWTNDGRIFIKPLPRFLLSLEVWDEYLNCNVDCKCQRGPAKLDTSNALQTPHRHGPDNLRGANINQAGSIWPQRDVCALRRCALGFLYSYVCLLTYESDFAYAKEHHLLPRSAEESEIHWDDWKKFSKEILAKYKEADVHPRFHRGELRLSRLNFFSRFTQWPLFTSYIRGWRNYGSLVRDNITSLATVTVFIALILTAMQVALATDQIKANPRLMDVSYGFSIFAIFAPLFVLFLVIIEVFYNLLKDNLLTSSIAKKQAEKKEPASDALV